MKSNYKKLAPYIRQIDERNKDLEVKRLLGVSIEKRFIESIANTIGTDMTSYKIVRKGQFAYGPVTSRNGDKVSIALLEVDECIISSSYIVFEITDTDTLLPEYLNLWFKRPEFDRYARFHSHGSAREIFDWEEMGNVMLPIPPIEEQQKIVNAYNAIEHRIAIKRQINDNLEAQIQSIYSDLFAVADYDATLGDLTECVLGGTPSRDEPTYWNGEIAWINSGKINDFRITTASEYITENGLVHSATKILPYHTVVIAITGATMGQESILLIESCANQSVIGVLENKNLPYEFIHPFIKASMRELLRNQTGGAQPHINKDDVSNIPICVPNNEQLTHYISMVKPLYTLIEKNCFEIDQLTNLLDNYLARLSR